MELDPVVSDLSTVPEIARGAYVQKDGKFVLPIKGDPLAALAGANGKIVELRDNNIAVLKALGVESVADGVKRAAAFSGIDIAKLEALKAIDPAEYAALKERVSKLKDKGVDDPDAYEAKLKNLVEAALKPVQDQLAAERTARTEAQQRADRALLRQTLGEKYVKLGGIPEVLDFILERAPFRVLGNEVKAAENKFSADKPGEPLSMDEWLVGTAAKEFGFAFKPSAGGGAAGGASNGNGGTQVRPGVSVVRGTKAEVSRRMNEFHYDDVKGLVDHSGNRVQFEYVE